MLVCLQCDDFVVVADSEYAGDCQHSETGECSQYIDVVFFFLFHAGLPCSFCSVRYDEAYDSHAARNVADVDLEHFVGVIRVLS